MIVWLKRVKFLQEDLWKRSWSTKASLNFSQVSNWIEWAEHRCTESCTSSLPFARTHFDLSAFTIPEWVTQRITRLPSTCFLCLRYSLKAWARFSNSPSVSWLPGSYYKARCFNYSKTSMSKSPTKSWSFTKDISSSAFYLLGWVSQNQYWLF